MALKPIILIPDQILRKESAPVAQVDDKVRSFIEDMFETMYDAPGIGLAAIQVAEPLRILTMDVTGKEEAEDGIKNPIAMINPKIVWASEERNVYEEGCLSIPEYFADVERPSEVRVEYIGLDGKEQHMHATGLTATCVEHEMDHLDGKLFIDYLSRMKRDMVVRKFTKMAKSNNTTMIG